MASDDQKMIDAETGDAVEGPVIEGGSIEPLKEIEVKTRRVRESTARTIALALVWILGLTAVVHYLGVFILILADKTEGIQELNHFFNAWLPVISGLVGSAITYYFTKER